MTESLFQKEDQYFFRTYKRLSLDIVRGEGAYLFDRLGKRYLDFFGGLAVNALGYDHPRVKQAIQRQLEKYIHLSNFFVMEPQVVFAEKLLNITGYQRLFLTNSGTEAIEGAIKLARKWGGANGKSMLYGLTNSFHGRTMGALSLTERPKYREGYEPFLPNVGHIKYNDVRDLRSKVGEQTLGIVVECLQGEGGVNLMSHEFAEELKSLRERYGFLLIADEIQSGVGRTGRFFGFEHFGLSPDIVVIAKAIGGGLPLGAFLGSEKVAGVFTYGVHGTTFGGNPVACAAGIAVLEEVVEHGLMRRAAEIGNVLAGMFLELKNEFSSLVKDVRGFGCMLGIELSREGQPVVESLQERGILVNCTNATVLRFLPPYIVSRDECETVVAELRSALLSL
ncbi:MAG: acetylornithine/succinylornithine family transaminase [Ignavibacteriales bacterium]|nr:acetylornithine/succinylornithine family transaminase [Ignavibacteriales bacterium]